jgi:GNAT superfamily N-acetyltransferase
MPSPHEIRPAVRADIPTIAELADRIWRAHYPGIITLEQIEYMLAQRYSPEALGAQVEGPDRWLDLLLVGGAPAGFANYFVASPAEVKLDKLYLLADARGQGHGRRLIERVESRARERGCARVVLAVNKHNAGAIRAYERSGFAVREAVRVEIGGGFVMDDYVMAKAV